MLRMSSTVFKCVSRDALMFLFFHTSLANTSKCDSSVTHAHSARASRIPRSATDRAHTHTHTLHAPREYLEVRQILLTASPPHTPRAFEVRQFTPYTTRHYLEGRQLQACFLHLSNFVPARGFRVFLIFKNQLHSSKSNFGEYSMFLKNAICFENICVFCFLLFKKLFVFHGNLCFSKI